ncbi:hypothetical protein MRX96_042195 [Rhipicephalus microplus]
MVPTPAGVLVDSPVSGSLRGRWVLLRGNDPRRPPGKCLDPYDLGPSSSSHGEAPASRGSSAALPVGDATYLLNNDNNALSDDVAVSTLPLDAGSSSVVLPGCPVYPASSLSPPASVDEAAAFPDQPDEVPQQPDSDNATL